MRTAIRGEAASAARAVVGAEPLPESARRALITVYFAEGNQAAAVGEPDLGPTPLLRRLVPHVAPGWRSMNCDPSGAGTSPAPATATR